MLDRLTELPAQTLGLEEYRADFRNHFWKIDVSWKLERQIAFKEPDSPSWTAMAEGDWNKALLLAEELRTPRTAHQRDLDRSGIVQRRIRFVSRPLTPYLQWELNVLRIWAELGEQIRILPEDTIGHLEAKRQLPEVLVLGDRSPTQVMYVIRYVDGVLAGAQKFTEPNLIDTCRKEIASLWRQGEEILPYFDREVAHLPPPTSPPPTPPPPTPRGV
ncbi:DUF6879 family protein [Thermopolyspora sp. NPDC052614]|uniref:DUF6879 family protein n=1 Tax=Thermopolyspora sp. NPDC052614 TaxID=3155682 RepID=UPI003442A0A0